MCFVPHQAEQDAKLHLSSRRRRHDCEPGLTTFHLPFQFQRRRASKLPQHHTPFRFSFNNNNNNNCQNNNLRLYDFLFDYEFLPLSEMAVKRPMIPNNPASTKQRVGHMDLNRSCKLRRTPTLPFHVPCLS